MGKVDARGLGAVGMPGGRQTTAGGEEIGGGEVAAGAPASAPTRSAARPELASRAHDAHGIQAWLATNRLACLLVPALLLLVWQLAADAGVLPATVLPAPSRIVDAAAYSLADGTLVESIVVSVARVLQGYAVGAVLGIAVGVVMGLSPATRNLLSLIVGILRPIPIIAWVPVLILWMGIDEPSKVTVIAIGTFWPVLINVTDGIENVDVKYREVAEVFVKPRRVTLAKVVFPAALPSVFTGLRVGVGTAWVSVISAELIAASSGLGYMISYARELAQPDTMLVGVLVIGVIGLGADTLIRIVERRALSWNEGVAR